MSQPQSTSEQSDVPENHGSANEPSGPVADGLPPLYHDKAFWGMTATQFFGAFNDNLFKQLMLLLAVPIGVASVNERDQQGLATAIFSLPFVLFSGYAGFLSDRYSKTPIIIGSKVAEIGVMLCGTLAFFAYGMTGYAGLLFVLFLMGVQSSFFGPGKYGILPEMLRPHDLPRANGVILMTTFLAIIFGTASAGLLGAIFVDRNRPLVESSDGLALGCCLCVFIAVIGTATSRLIRRVPAARPNLRFCWSALTIPPETRDLLWRDRPLLGSIGASSMFWLVSGIAIQVVNSLGLVQLQVNELFTSLMTAVIAIGIAGGAVIAGRLCHGRPNPKLVSYGQWGMFACLLLLAIWLPDGRHLLGYYGCFPVLILLGGFAGIFAIPIQVFLQSRPPKGQKGRLIAVMNQANFTAILLSGVLYDIFGRVANASDWPRSSIFGMIAVLLLPTALLYKLPDQGRQPTD